MFGAALALGSSLGYGIGDFLGGTTSRRIGTLRFIFCAQIVGVVLAGGWLVLAAGSLPPFGTVAAAAGAGVAITVGLSAFFQAMAIGTMSLVAPISAPGVARAVAVGILGGEHPSAVQVLGILAAIAGVVLVTRTSGERRADRTETGIGLA